MSEHTYTSPTLDADLDAERVAVAQLHRHAERFALAIKPTAWPIASWGDGHGGHILAVIAEQLIRHCVISRPDADHIPTSKGGAS